MLSMQLKSTLKIPINAACKQLQAAFLHVQDMPSDAVLCRLEQVYSALQILLALGGGYHGAACGPNNVGGRC